MPQQVSRLLAVFAVSAIALAGARYYLVPDTFGEKGHYRAAAIDSVLVHPRKYAGHHECAVCHAQINERRVAGNHRGVACEVCHGPALNHANAPLDTKPPAPRERSFCILCHSYNPSRPTGFPQIDPISHNPLSPCMNCHDPHEPEPPVVPEECSACHGQIARQKAVSHHATVPCTTCHAAPREHKVEPRAARPSKPTERAFCGACHATDAPSPARIPRIDLGDHNPDYQCWQCHYPHYPETDYE
ncbi:MAG: cytochrome c3 family protein [Gemmatimonadales bacterium]